MNAPAQSDTTDTRPSEPGEDRHAPSGTAVIAHVPSIRDINEALYSTLVETSPDAIILTALDLTILFCNAPAAALYGSSAPGDLFGRNALDFLAPGAARESVLRALGEHAIAALADGVMEYDVVRADGTSFPAEVRVNIVTGDGGLPLGYVAVVRDVSERKRAEQALLTSEQRYRELFERNRVGIYRTDTQGRFLECNEALAHMLGVSSRKELLQHLATEFYFEASDRGELLRAILEHGGYTNHEVRLRRADGLTIWALESATLFDTGREGSVAIEGTLTDITRRKAVEEALSRSEERFQYVSRATNDTIYDYDPVSGAIWWNEALLTAFGYDPEGDCGYEWWAANVHPSDRARVVKSLDRAIKHGEEQWSEEYRFRRADTTYAYVLDRGYFIRNEQGSSVRMIGSIADISKSKQAEEAIRASERRYRQLFENNLAGVYRTTLDGRFLDCNDAMVRLLRCDSREQILASNCHDFYLDPPERGSLIHRLLEHGTITNLEVCYRRHDGSLVWVLENMSLVDGEDGGADVLEGTLIDITERKMLEQHLTHQAFHDPLTRLPNRALFMDRLGHALTRTGRKEETVAVLFLDLDNFKTVNDNLGHKVGDQLLVAMGQRLLESVRPADTVARLGGDEFTLLVEDVRDMEDANGLAQRIVDALSRPFFLDGRDVFVTPSVGVALNTGVERPEDLLRNADLAMYQAKNSGKARFVIYEPELDQHVWERLQHETELRRALDAGEFTIYYQPVVRLVTGEVAEVEALVRWQHPQRGLVPPLDFIPLAEETGVILPMGRGVLEQACAQVARWRLEVPGAANLVLSVNVSPRQFRHARFADDVRRALDATGLPASALKLEIPENAGLDNSDETVGIMRGLKALGVAIAVDDFGTGYASLSYLRYYPIDTLKLDRLFTGGVDSAEDIAIVRAVIAFANSLDLSVIAEGIETREQAEQLRSLGCTLGQGFYFARPLPAGEVERFLQTPVSA